MTEKKIVKIEERIPQLKERRKQRTNRRLIFYVSLFFSLMLLIIYFQSPFSQVQNVEVTGNDFASTEWIVEESGLLNEVSMWNIGVEGVRDRLTGHEAVNDVVIERAWLNTVVITVEEYERAAYVYDGDSYVPVLLTGELFYSDKENITPYDAPVLRGFEDDAARKEMVTELGETPEEIRQRISDIFLEPVENDAGRLKLLMNDGFTVSSTLNNFADRISPYPSVVEQLDPDERGIVHMRMNPYFERFSGSDGQDEEEEEASDSEE